MKYSEGFWPAISNYLQATNINISIENIKTVCMESVSTGVLDIIKNII